MISIGHVLRSSTTDFVVDCKIMKEDTPQFGALVKVKVTPHTHIIGVIHDVTVRDDPSVRQLILSGTLAREAVLDQRENRLVPIEIGVLILGFQRKMNFVQALPPQPPISLEELALCSIDEIVAFTEQLDFLRFIINAQHAPADDLAVACLTRAAELRAPEIRRDYLLAAGRYIGRLLFDDMRRFDTILQQLKTVVPSA